MSSVWTTGRDVGGGGRRGRRTYGGWREKRRLTRANSGCASMGPQAGLLDHVDRLPQLACALLVTLPRLIPFPWVRRSTSSFLPGPRKQTCCCPYQRNLYNVCNEELYVGQPAVISYHRPGSRVGCECETRRRRRQISRASVCKYIPIVNL